jgi:hypothetical protein
MKATFHLPGLFEFYELYRLFLPLFYEHREYFYDWCEIGSVYGAPADCLWGGGRVGAGDAQPEEAAALMRAYGISARLTLSNSLLRPEHLTDTKCNALCALFERSSTVPSGVIVASDLLLGYLKERYPGFYFVSSTTKVLTDFPELERELRSASHRDSDTGFLLGQPEVPGEAEGFHQEREYAARVLGRDEKTGKTRLMLKNRFFAGEQLELMTRKGILQVTASPLVREKTGETLETLGIAGETILMDLPECEAGDILRGPVRNHRE